jgi:hypothetical protein
MKNENKYGRQSFGSSAEKTHPTPPPGFSLWIEDGNWFIAPTVDPAKFGPHDYNARRNWVGDCTCGCYMGRESSSGPCDPFGACPENPNPFAREPQHLDAADGK